MNSTLSLKGNFSHAPNPSKGGGKYKFPRNNTNNIASLISLRDDLSSLRVFWNKEQYLNDILVSVHYNNVIAKSNRIQSFFSKGKITANSLVVGAKFSNDLNLRKHIITYYIPDSFLDTSIIEITNIIKILEKNCITTITNDWLEKINKDKSFDFTPFSRTSFISKIVELYYVERFAIPSIELETNKQSIITLYKTENKTIELLRKFNIRISEKSIIDETTILLSPTDLELLKNKAPYLISMAIKDLSNLPIIEGDYSNEDIISIPKPSDEPIVGVIDTMFDKEVYFSEWVDFTNVLPSDIILSNNDYIHGTAVSSIIVDGPSFNPELNDNCGRFRVKHFGVAAGKKFSSFSVIQSIQNIVAANPKIKVWNISLGSPFEINPNSISPEAAILDKIQFDYDVIFIIAGTNNNFSYVSEDIMKIGAPADSINSIVVNSVDFENKPAKYSRTGPVLSFYTKPDVSYYGNNITVCTRNGSQTLSGTSFAAPWITRKIAYMINVLGFSREVAKAMLIHSSTNWDIESSNYRLLGYGVAPKKIDNIISRPSDEIQFVISGEVADYTTYSYSLPVPFTRGENGNFYHPFISKATLCYFPYCSRNQGVDYTNTELEFSFGIVTDKGVQKKNDYRLKNYELSYLSEDNARKHFRKWDNVKHIRKKYTGRNRSLKAHYSKMWGVKVTCMERLENKYGENLKFGLVVTLKEIDGKNTINQFIQMLQMKGWIVNTIDINEKVDIYNKAEENIDFEN